MPAARRTRPTDTARWREALARAVAAFNDPTDREPYFRLYDDEVELHGYPPGVERLAEARAFYRAMWQASPEAVLEVTGIEELADGLRVRFRYAGSSGITTLRFHGDRVVERWQGR